MAETDEPMGFEIANTTACCEFVRDKTGLTIAEWIRAYIFSNGEDEYFAIEAITLGEYQGFAIPIEIAKAHKLFDWHIYRKVT